MKEIIFCVIGAVLLLFTILFWGLLTAIVGILLWNCVRYIVKRIRKTEGGGSRGEE